MKSGRVIGKEGRKRAAIRFPAEYDREMADFGGEGHGRGLNNIACVVFTVIFLVMVP